MMTRVRGYHWPPGVPREDSLEAWVGVFEMFGYRICDNAELQAGIEKIAIYLDSDGTPSHVAKQMSYGLWTSKLGKREDIEHETLEGLEGDVFSRVGQVMERTRQVEGV